MSPGASCWHLGAWTQVVLPTSEWGSVQAQVTAGGVWSRGSWAQAGIRLIWDQGPGCGVTWGSGGCRRMLPGAGLSTC